MCETNDLSIGNICIYPSEIFKIPTGGNACLPSGAVVLAFADLLTLSLTSRLSSKLEAGRGSWPTVGLTWK